MGKTNGEHESLKNDWVLEEMIKIALEDEMTGREKYRRLARMAMRERDRKMIFAIADEEGCHEKMLRRLYRELYGRPVSKVRPRKEKIGSFTDGIRKSIAGEYESVGFYRELLGKFTEESMKKCIRSIMADEQRHGQVLEGVLENR